MSGRCCASSRCSATTGPRTTSSAGTGRIADDGARVPVSIMHRAGLQFPAPTLLYGYGAYESCEDPRFSIARLSLLDRGMVFVVAHVRGGGELGRPWYEHGKLLEKKNTFTDFIAVARHLVETGRDPAARIWSPWAAARAGC